MVNMVYHSCLTWNHIYQQQQQQQQQQQRIK